MALPKEDWEDIKAVLRVVNRAAELYRRPLGLRFDDEHQLLIVDPPTLTLRQRISLLFFG